MNDAFGARLEEDKAWRAAAVALVAELRGRGLRAEALAQGAVRAKNPAGEPNGNDPLGQMMAPGLGQEVRCRRHGSGDTLWWHWVWSGPTRSSPSELEPLCPIRETATAAERIARVLAVPFADAPVEGSG